MNINEYKKSLDLINVKKFTTEELMNRNNKKITHKKMIKFTFAYILIGFFVLYNIFPLQRPRFTITAYAAENEIQLTNSFVNCNVNVRPLDGGTDNGKDGYVNSNIYFKCEGKDINSITYTCSDQVVNVNNRKSAAAYYVENMIIPRNEYNEHIKDNNFIYGYYAPGGDTANITNLIGNSYSVNYEDQNNKQYGLVIAATVDNTGCLKINDAIIKIDVYFNDGTIQHKKIVLKSGKDALGDMQIQIL